MLERVIYAGTHEPSFAQASQALWAIGELKIPTKQVERLTQRIGEERCVRRDAEVGEYLSRPLVERKSVPAGMRAPEVAVVQMDGGRLQIRDRGAAPAEPSEASPDPAASESKHWREDKVGLLASMTSSARDTDPCPTIPEHFIDPCRILKLARQIKGTTGVSEDPVASASPDGEAAAVGDGSYTAPVLGERSVVATRSDAHAFGEMLSQAAWSRGFYGAARRAFVADGSSANWGVWQRHFSNFTPVVDFIHALTYVFSGAMAGRPFASGWSVYREWIGRVWSGEVELVIAALRVRQVEVGEPEADEAESSPRCRVAEALSYLEGQKDRMRYGEYRKQGLPITSSHVESTIKRINQRVKGTEKFWSESGAEAILQLRADVLSETEPLAKFWERRQATATGQRRYSRAA